MAKKSYILCAETDCRKCRLSKSFGRLNNDNINNIDNHSNKLIGKLVSVHKISPWGNQTSKGILALSKENGRTYGITDYPENIKIAKTFNFYKENYVYDNRFMKVPYFRGEYSNFCIINENYGEKTLAFYDLYTSKNKLIITPEFNTEKVREFHKELSHLKAAPYNNPLFEDYLFRMQKSLDVITDPNFALNLGKSILEMLKQNEDLNARAKNFENWEFNHEVYSPIEALDKKISNTRIDLEKKISSLQNQVDKQQNEIYEAKKMAANAPKEFFRTLRTAQHHLDKMNSIIDNANAERRDLLPEELEAVRHHKFRAWIYENVFLDLDK